jgi:hypothetical protein
VTRCYLRLARDRPAHEAAGLLEEALGAAQAAGDQPRRAEVLARLVRARWEQGAVREAAVALGRLTATVGAEAAERACPAGLAAELDRWRGAVAEGRAASVRSGAPR